MKPRFRHDMDRNYMVLEAPESLQGSDYQVRMLLANDIPGCLKARMRMIDNKMEFFYDITSKQPVGRIYEKKRMGSRDIRALVEGLYRAFEGAAVFLLDGKCFLLDPALMYMDVESCELYLCYLPSSQEEGEDAFRKLTEYILKRLDHRDDQAVLWGYALYSKTEVENYSPREALRESLRQTWGAGKEPVEKGLEIEEKKKDEKIKDREEKEGEEKEGEKERDKEKEGEREGGKERGKNRGNRKVYRGKRTWGTGKKDSMTEERAGERRGRSGREQSGTGSPAVPVSRHKRKRTQKGKKGVRRRRLCAAGIGILVIGGIAALGLLEILSLTQTGGLLFLTICVGVYLFLNDEKQGEQQTKQGRDFIKEEKRVRQNTVDEKRRSEAAKSAIIPVDILEAEEEPYEFYEQAEEDAWDMGTQTKEDAWDMQEQTKAKEDGREIGEQTKAKEDVRDIVVQIKAKEDVRGKRVRTRAEENVWEEGGRTALAEETVPKEQVQDCTLPSRYTEGDASQDDIGTAYGQTTVLQEGSYGVFPVLISIHPEIRENIVMDRELLVIGKMKGQADILLNLPAVSRIHAKLERKPEGCFLTDLNSTNGTFVNGERLQADECRQVRTGDEIFFAGAGYYMKI